MRTQFGTSMSTQPILLVVSARKGSAVRRLKGYASWVKYVVRQYGSYLLMIRLSKLDLFFVRKDLNGLTSGITVV